MVEKCATGYIFSSCHISEFLKIHLKYICILRLPNHPAKFPFICILILLCYLLSWSSLFYLSWRHQNMIVEQQIKRERETVGREELKSIFANILDIFKYDLEAKLLLNSLLGYYWLCEVRKSFLIKKIISNFIKKNQQFKKKI